MIVAHWITCIVLILAMWYMWLYTHLIKMWWVLPSLATIYMVYTLISLTITVYGG